MKNFQNVFEQLLLEKKKKKHSKNRWKPKKYYRNSTYAFYPHGGIGSVGGDGGGDGGGGGE